MGIFDRLSRLIRSNINDAIAKAENPEKMLTQIIEDMRKQLAQAKQEVATAIADERKLRAQYEQQREQADEWENRARLAVKEGRDDLAKQALQRGQEHADHAAELEEQWQQHRQETERLKESLRRLNSKIEEAKRKKNLLLAKQKRAQAQRRIQDSIQGLEDKSAFRAFEKMTEEIEERERQALAASEVDEQLTGDTLEQKFEAIEGETGGDVDQKLLALKEEMGLLGDGGSPKQLNAGSESGEVRDAEIIEEESDDLAGH